VQNVSTVLLDWLSFTFPVSFSVESVLEFLGVTDASPMERGLHGYRSGYRSGSLVVLYDGAENMGVHVQLSGAACREVEGLPTFAGWPGFARSLIASGVNSARLDFAIDCRSGEVTKERIEAAYAGGLIVSRYRSSIKTEGGNIQTGKDCTYTRYFGSSKSDTRVRIYDKAAEQKTTDGLPWMRVELQMRDARSSQALQYIAAADTLEGLGGVVLALLDFKQAASAGERTDWVTASWWSGFLGGLAKVRLGVAPAVRTIEEVVAWIDRQAGALLAVVVAHAEGDLSGLLSIIAEGRSRWKDRHRRLLGAAQGAAYG
jgi:phage replication initiation protein